MGSHSQRWYVSCCTVNYLSDIYDRSGIMYFSIMVASNITSVVVYMVCSFLSPVEP